MGGNTDRHKKMIYNIQQGRTMYISTKFFPFSIRCWDSNPRPVEHESPPITTRPGLPPYNSTKLEANDLPSDRQSNRDKEICTVID